MIVFVHACRLEWLPPLASLVRLLRDHGEKILFLEVQHSAESEKMLRGLGVDYRLGPIRVVSAFRHPVRRLWQLLTRPLQPCRSRRWIWQQIEPFVEDPELILWTAEMPATALVGRRALSLGRRHIASLYELGDERGARSRGFDRLAFYRSATLVVCEHNRARIMQEELALSRLPFVMPNKPYPHPQAKYLPIQDPQAAEIVRGWKDQRVFLYQGALQEDRAGLWRLLEKLCRLFPSCRVAVMGAAGEKVSRLQEQYSNFDWIPYVSPPEHLEVTSHATIGIAYYEPRSVWGFPPLNAEYCAPNKIYEYAGFGIPMLCNDVTGLRDTVGASGAGICLSDFQGERFVKSVQELLDQADEFGVRARAFFEATNIEIVVADILRFARGGGK